MDRMVNLMAEMLLKDLEIYERDTAKELSFTLCTGRMAYGMEINYVTKIVGLHKMMKIAGVPNNIKGIIHFKDRFIPVIDMKVRSNKEVNTHNNRASILVIEIKKFLVGVIIDNSNEVLNMDTAINFLVMMNLIKLPQNALA